LLEVATNVLEDFNMSASMARPGDWAQLGQSDMRVLLNMAKMAKDGWLPTAMEETKWLNEKPHVVV
jgi:hypothetical protein